MLRRQKLRPEGGRGRTTTKGGWFTSQRRAADCDWRWSRLQAAGEREINGEWRQFATDWMVVGWRVADGHDAG
ncbi:hypothetical protein CISIN_1g038774mg [Citrus sinensis]|uniref:Uncharacterized protein n=1 Tax=Citrus sinensis TaxID=2711 RepID=A0A067D398_CITSI|nr:hypothetical protein CISIN_1g038774mg [Citrus sinensis]